MKGSICVFVAANIFGCAATTTAISKRNLDVQTKMSDTIFLDPVSPKNKTIFVQMRNGTDQASLDIAAGVKQAIVAKGYILKDDPDQANFILQANILSISKGTTNPMNSTFGGYGAALGGAAIGGLASAATGGTGRNMAGTALIAGAVVGLGSLIADALVKDVYYTAITDVQIKERTKPGVMSSSKSNQNLKNGNSGGTSVVTDETIGYKIFQTRIMSVANQVNLELVDAIPLLDAGLSRVISGVFE